MITDDLWDTLGPAARQAKRYTCGQPPALPDRMFLEALLYWARTGIPWRDLPDVFGAWDAVYNRFRRWVGSGSLTALFEVLTAGPGLRGGPAGVARLDDHPGPRPRGRRPAEGEAERSSGCRRVR